METDKKANGVPEIEAISAVHSALKDLDAPAQARVLRYVAEMLQLNFKLGSQSPKTEEFETGSAESVRTLPPIAPPDSRSDDDIEGVNAIALKWMKRSDLAPKSLGTLFSLGIDEIDLVSKKVPGESKKERMRSVILLKGIAAYLSSGAARFTYEQLKEACLHYNAYDSTNFATYLKSFAAEVGGTKEAGFTLTARGLASATELVKTMLGRTDAAAAT
jgi:hypothetical protein